MTEISKNALAALLLAGSTLIYAGVTGKIQGSVSDQNGLPLPGANIMLDGTNRGAAADVNGFYIILNISPGKYSLTAQMIGFKGITKTDVTVNSDRTTKVNFALYEEAIGMEEVRVTAEKPKVEVDRTYSEYIVTADDIERSVMVKSVADLISLQPGMDVNGQGMIRGGDMNSIAADVVYYVDGVKMTSNDGLTLNNFIGVGKYDIETISIITGGLSAEYGNAQAGVINIVTKEGTDSFHGNFEYTNDLGGANHWGPNYYDAAIHRGKMKWDNPEWVNEIDSTTGQLVHQKIDYTKYAGYALQGNITGPLMKGVSFSLGGRTNNNAVNSISPLSHSADNFEGTWKLSLNLHPKISLKFGGVYSQNWNYHSVAGVGGIKGMGDDGKNIFLPMDNASSGKIINTNQMSYMAISHMLSERTYYELRVSNSVNTQTPEDFPDSTMEITKDEDGWFNLHRDVYAFNEGERTRFQVKFDFTSQFNKNNLLKTGIDYIDYSVWARNYSDVLNSRQLHYIGYHHRTGNPVRPKQFAWYIQDKMEYKGLVLNAGIRMDHFDPSVKHPLTTAMAASDYFFDTFTRFNYDSLESFGLLEKTKPITAWSPRIGVAHPITDRSMIHFFYGHIYQLASFYTMYGERWVNDGTRDTDINSNNLNDDTELYNTLEESFFGNPRLTYEKTISFELGFDWNFYSDYILALSTFYKSSSNQVSSPGTVQLNWWDPAKQLFDFQFTHMAGNGIHEDIQGFELSLKKNFNNYFGFNIAYNIQWAVKGEAGVGSQFWIPDSAFVADGKFWMFHSENDDGSESGNPLGFFGTAIATKANIFLDSLRALGMEIHDAGNTGLHWVEFWGGTEEEPKPDADIRNYGKAQIFIATPDKFGPMGLFGNITANIVYRMSTGNPFEYSPIGGASEWRNGPLTTRTDLSFEKVIYQKNTAKGTLYIQVSNLFDQRDVRGDGGFSSIYGPGEFIRWGMETPRPDNKQYQDYGDFYGNSRYHGSPREIQIGIRTSF